jgi:hypothetical protein
MSGTRSARSSGARLRARFCIWKARPKPVSVTVTVTGLAPGVTGLGSTVAVTPCGKPVTVNNIAAIRTPERVHNKLEVDAAPRHQVETGGKRGGVQLEIGDGEALRRRDRALEIRITVVSGSEAVTGRHSRQA